MNLNTIKLLIFIALFTTFFLTPLSSSIPLQSFNNKEILLETGFENEWTLDNDRDFLAPMSDELVWDIDDLTNHQDQSNWMQIQSTGKNDQYIHLGKASAGIWPKTQGNTGEDSANNDWLITPSIDCLHYYDITLEFWSQYHPTYLILMPFYQEIYVKNTYLVKISIDNGKTWQLIADLRDDETYKLGGENEEYKYFNMFEVPIIIPLDFYTTGKSNVKIAWHYTYDGIGPAERWIIDDVSITGIKDTEKPDLTLLAPKQKTIYLNNKEISSWKKTVLIGDYTIKVDPTDSGVGTAYVTFSIDDIVMKTDTTYPYNYEWNQPSFGNKQITITAVDYAGYSETIEFNVIKIG